MKLFTRYRFQSGVASLLTALCLTSCVYDQGKPQQAGNEIDPKSPVVLEENQDRQKVIKGLKNNKEPFQILLPEDYFLVFLEQTEFYDMTGDSRKEMCVALDIANNLVSDVNSIHVYDSVSLDLLFPTEDKSCIYTGKIIETGEKGFPHYAIDYESFSKSNMVGFTEEKSLVGWMDGRFQTLRYSKKLLALDETRLIAVFLKDYSPYSQSSVLKLSVETVCGMEQNAGGENIQDISVALGTELDPEVIVQKIAENNLVLFDDCNKDEYLDIIIQLSDSSIVYEWNHESGLFEPQRIL